MSETSIQPGSPHVKSNTMNHLNKANSETDGAADKGLDTLARRVLDPYVGGPKKDETATYGRDDGAGVAVPNAPLPAGAGGVVDTQVTGGSPSAAVPGGPLI